jgi:hypothetical protein
VTVFSNLEINGTTYQVTARVRKEDFRVNDGSLNAQTSDYSEASQPIYDVNGDIILEWKDEANADSVFWKVDYTFSPSLLNPSHVATISSIKSNTDGGKSPWGGASGLQHWTDDTTSYYFQRHHPVNEGATAITANDEVKKIHIQFYNNVDPSNPIHLAEGFLLLDFNVLWLPPTA